MKKISLLFFFALVCTNAIAQKDFQGMAIYESKTSTADFKARFEGNKSITPDVQKMMEERMKKMFEKTFILNFDKSASIYKEEEKLEASNQGGGMRMMMGSMTGGGGTYYKNVKDKTYSIDKDFMGKEFLVKDSLASLNWKMEAETRVIGGYTCYKATAIKAPSKTDFRNFRPKKEDTPKKEEASQPEKPKEAPKTSFMDALELPKEITITAWYTPEIPVNQGPEGYWGLPGLILEVNDGKTIILCSKLVLNPKEKTEIKAPSKGKVVSQNEYDEIMVKKMEEFREMNQGGRGGAGFQVRFSQ